MLSLLICFISSELISINDQNYKNILKRTNKTPLFLKVWSQWCPHCLKLSPIFNELDNITSISSKIEFAQLNCDIYTSLCKEISDNIVPSLVFYSDSNQKIVYNGNYDLNGLIFFLQKQLYQCLRNVTSESELKELIQESDYGVAYLFTIRLVDPVLDIILNISRYYEGSSQRFYLISNSTIRENSLTAFVSHNQRVDYRGNWSEDSIIDFLISNSFALLENLNHDVLLLSKVMNKRIAWFCIKDSSYRDEIIDWNLSLRNDIQYCIDVISQPTFTSIRLLFNLTAQHSHNYFVIIDPKKAIVWKNLSIPFTKEGLDELINVSFLDTEMALAYGPGSPSNSIMQQFRFLIIMKFGIDPPLSLFITIFVGSLVLIILYIIIQRMKIARNKKID